MNMKKEHRPNTVLGRKAYKRREALNAFKGQEQWKASEDNEKRKRIRTRQRMERLAILLDE
jgi:hypothetical protein